MSSGRPFAPMLHEWSGELSERDYRALGLLYARAVWRSVTVTRTVCRAAKGGQGVRYRKTVVLQPGQLLASVRTLAEDWGWSRQRVHRALTSLRAKEILVVVERMGDAGTVHQLPVKRRDSQKRSSYRRFRAVSTGVPGQRGGLPGQPERAKAGQPEAQFPSALPSKNGSGAGQSERARSGHLLKKTTGVKHPIDSNQGPRARSSSIKLRELLAEQGIELPRLEPPRPEPRPAMTREQRREARRALRRKASHQRGRDGHERT